MKLGSILITALSAILFNSKDAFTNAESQLKTELYDKVRSLKSEVHPFVLDGVVTNQLIWGDEEETTTTMKLLWVVYLSGLVEKTTCKKQEFGVDNEYTDLVCDAHKVATTICEEEKLCDDEAWKDMPVYAMSGKVLADKELVSRSLCSLTGGGFTFTPSGCPDAIAETMERPALQIQDLIKMLPDQFDNQLISLGGVDPVEYSTFGENRIHGWGDSFLNIREEIYGDLFETFVKIHTIEALATFIRDKHQKLGSTESEFSLTNDQRFYLKSLEGYLLQKYSSYFFSDVELVEVLPKFFDFVDVDCALYYGAYSAFKCTSLDTFLNNQDSTAAELDFSSATDSCSVLKDSGEDAKNMISTGKNMLKFKIGVRCVNACEDNPGKFKVGIDGNSNKGSRTCDWVIRTNDPGPDGVPRRCVEFPEIAEECPDTCLSCCKDSTELFFVSDAPTPGNKHCDWVAGRKTDWKCKMNNVANFCPKTCGIC